MGKAGKKKKGKITGTPDVVKFKGTREFCLLQECVTIQESLPFVAVDALDESAFKKVARFLNMVGLLAEHLAVHTNKDYRFQYHHKYLYPTPQFFPFGFDVQVIRHAREIQEKPGITYNGELQPYPEELRTLAEKFLKDVDSHMTRIASQIEPHLKNDFANGLKRFKLDLHEDIETFDALWMEYEREYSKVQHEILAKVFRSVDQLVTIELLLTQSEERLDIENKQRFENEFIFGIEDFTKRLMPETKAESWPEDVIPLAEACIFYESKCTDEWLHVAKHLIKDYLELRIYISKIPEDRVKPQLKDNDKLMRHLKTFHESVLSAREALDFVAKLPRLIHAKTSTWMTKKLFDPDLQYIKKMQAYALDISVN